MKRVFLHIERLPNGRVSINSDGDSAQLAGLAVKGVRHIVRRNPEYADDMKAVIDRDFRRKRDTAEIIFEWFLYLLLAIGALVLLMAIIYGTHCLGAAALAWLERVEAAAIRWGSGG